LGNGFSAIEPWTTPNWSVEIPVLPVPSLVPDRLVPNIPSSLRGNDVLSGKGRFSLDGGTINAHVSYGAVVVGSVSTSVGRTFDAHELAMVDINGDGAADHVLRIAGQESVYGSNPKIGKIFVKENLVRGESNLLVKVKRPLHGVIDIEYARTANTVDMPSNRLVMKKVTVNDGQDLGLAFDSPNLFSEYEYEDGYFDREEKEFFGFGTFTIKRPDGAKTTQIFENRDYTLKGTLKHEEFRDASGALFEETDNETCGVGGNGSCYEKLPVVVASNAALFEPICASKLHPLLKRNGNFACEVYFPVLKKATSRSYEGGVTFKQSVSHDFNFDEFGNLTESLDEADDASHADDLYANTTFQNDPSKWIIGRFRM
jgi:Insecticide toxin TcdB middle/N-terminal region